MVVFLDRKRLESALIEGAGPSRLVMRVPAPYVCDGQPLHECGQRVVTLGPEYQVPVIGHHDERQETHFEPFMGLCNTFSKAV